MSALIIEPTTLTIFAFDIIEEEGHRRAAEWTSFPVESGLAVSDHAIDAPPELSLKGVVSDHPLAGAPTPQRSKGAWEKLVALLEAHRLVTVVSGLEVYTDMGLLEVGVSRSPETGEAIEPTVTLRKVRIVQSVTVPVPPEILAPKVIGAASPVHTQLDIEQMNRTFMGDRVVAVSMADLGGETGSSFFPRPGESGSVLGAGGNW